MFMILNKLRNKTINKNIYYSLNITVFDPKRADPFQEGAFGTPLEKAPPFSDQKKYV